MNLRLAHRHAVDDPLAAEGAGVREESARPSASMHPDERDSVPCALLPPALLITQHPRALVQSRRRHIQAPRYPTAMIVPDADRPYATREEAVHNGVDVADQMFASAFIVFAIAVRGHSEVIDP